MTVLYSYLHIWSPLVQDCEEVCHLEVGDPLGTNYGETTTSLILISQNSESHCMGQKI